MENKQKMTVKPFPNVIVSLSDKTMGLHLSVTIPSQVANLMGQLRKQQPEMEDMELLKMAQRQIESASEAR